MKRPGPDQKPPLGILARIRAWFAARRRNRREHAYLENSDHRIHRELLAHRPERVNRQP